MDRKLKTETVFYGISKYASVILTLLTTVVLSHVLSPEEYGIVAVTTVFTSFFSVIADMGFGTAVIQNKTLTDDEVNDIYSFSVYASIGLAVLFALLGLPISAFYADTVYRKICALLSLSVLFAAMNIVPHGALMKKKRFKLMGLRLTCAALVTGVIAIIMACAGFSYYALVFQSILHSLFIFLWNQWNARLKFKPRFNMQSVRKVQQYSMNQFAFSIVNYCERNFDNLMISKVLGSVSLAYYDKGYKLMMYPVQNLTYVISPVLHPVLSEHQEDKDYIYNAYLKVARILSLMGVFISVFCFWNSREIILLFFGDQWVNSIPLFRVLSLSVWPQMVSSSAASIYQSTGNTKLLFRSSLIHSGVTALLIIAGVLTGDLETVSILVVVSLFLRFFIDFYFLVVRNFGKTYFGFLTTFKGDAVIVLLMVAAIMLMRFVSIDNILLSMLVKGSVLLAVYLVGVKGTGQLHCFTELFRRRGKVK